MNEYNFALSSHFWRKLFVQNRRHLFDLCNYIDIDRLITLNWNMMYVFLSLMLMVLDRGKEAEQKQAHLVIVLCKTGLENGHF